MFEWALHIIESGGYSGIFFLMVLENIFPPIPSELVLPLAGFAAAKGDLHIIGVLASATLGAVVGCLPWYFLGRLCGIARVRKLSERYGRIMTVSPQDVDDAQVWFHQHGHIAVFFGRLVPTIRTLISVPAGISRMPLLRFLGYTTIGTFLWTMLLSSAGYILESQYDKVSVFVNVLSDVIVAGIILWYLYRVTTFKVKR